jgi:cytoskeletal protein RodZ
MPVASEPPVFRRPAPRRTLGTDLRRLGEVRGVRIAGIALGVVALLLLLAGLLGNKDRRDRVVTGPTTTVPPAAFVATTEAATTTTAASTTTTSTSSTSSTTTTTVATTTSRPPTTTATATPTTGVTVFYANCTEAKAAGAAPLRRGDPGYRPALDRDGDGIACE